VAAGNVALNPPDTNKLKLALISFVSLFLELAIIRWLASEVRIFAYFKNLPLFAAFLGLGAGLIIAPSRRNYFRYTPLFLLASVLVIGLAPRFGYTHIIFADPYEYYLLGGWKNPSAFTMIGGLGLLAGVFALIVFLFVGIGEKVGEYLDAANPLSAYSINIAAGLAGVLTYTILSYMRTGPAVWVLVAILPLIPFFWRSRNILVLAAISIVVPFMPKANAWSPYYRIDLEQISAEAKNGEMLHQGYTVNVNHDGILGAYDLREDFVSRLSDRQKHVLIDYYNVVYRIFGKRFQKVLVLGAGAGNDVAAALRNGATQVDAVEIDPAIIDIGFKYHPEKPYESGLVKTYAADARAFLRDDSHSGYDLIVLGMLDSHTVLSSMSSIRLDNYVYTVESFQQALRRLQPNGVLALSFFYYEDWQMARVFDALWKANGEMPVVVHSLGAGWNNLVLLAGPGAPRAKLLNHPYVIAHSASDMVGNGSVEPTTDDWPFLYLKKRALPSGYFSMLIVVLGLSYLVSRRTAQLSTARTDWAMFFFGVGFMLLETKVMAKIALLVGTTWIVNSFVIAAVLLMILLANFSVARASRVSLGLAFSGIFLTLLSDWLFRIGGRSLVTQPLVNLLISLLCLVIPIFFAAIAFAEVLKGRGTTSTALGYNLVGAMVGGTLEYLSTIWGINNLNLLCIGAYLCAAIACAITLRRPTARGLRTALPEQTLS
jgi:SAM-dependent methyltransferase